MNVIGRCFSNSVGFLCVGANRLYTDYFSRDRLKNHTARIYDEALIAAIAWKGRMLPYAIPCIKKTPKSFQWIPLPPLPIILSLRVPCNEALSKKEFYHHPAFTQEDKENVDQIISLLADAGRARLLASIPRFMELGGKIKEVHPFRLLERVLDPALKEKMKAISQDSDKWWFFLNGKGDDGLVHSLQRHADAKQLQGHIEAFANAVGANPQIVAEYAASCKWEEMIRYLLANA